jgi:hypothetical protein
MQDLILETIAAVAQEKDYPIAFRLIVIQHLLELAEQWQTKEQIDA